MCTWTIRTWIEGMRVSAVAHGIAPDIFTAMRHNILDQSWNRHRTIVRVCRGQICWTSGPLWLKTARTGPTRRWPKGLLDFSQKWFWQCYLHWTQGHSNSEMDQTCAAAISGERSFLCLYYKVFGNFPPLNKRKPNMIGVELDAAWLAALNDLVVDPAKHNPVADAAVEMLDTDGAMPSSLAPFW